MFSYKTLKISLLLVISLNVHSSAYEYLFPNTLPSFSNYGTTGLLQLPNARHLEAGSLGFSWTHNEPYLRGSILAYPFDWFEASYQYVDINNALYSPFESFSGTQSAKDKSFDVKFLLIRETRMIPNVSIGLRDIAGTGLFSSEYIVASKLVKNTDFTLGLGWGILDQNKISNPLGKISKKFYSRNNLDGDVTGGTFNYGQYFRGDPGLFFGLEHFFSGLKGLRLKLEFDGTNYDNEGVEPLKQDSKINLGFEYPVNENFSIKAGYIRGNTLSFGFSFKGNFARKNKTLSKRDKLKTIENSEVYKRVNSREDRYLYLTSLQFLKDNKFYLQEANIDNDTLEISYTQGTYNSYPIAIGRITNILDQISPENIKNFRVTNLNAGLQMNTVEINRREFRNTKSYNDANSLKRASYVTRANENLKDYSFRPKKGLPNFYYKINPDLRSQIGGPDGFYFGDLRLKLNSELIFKPNITVTSEASIGVFDNLDQLKLPSNSELPHVRTEIVNYLKESRDFGIHRLQANYFSKPFKDIYFKFSTGIFEDMFGGYGGEILYRPFYQNFAVGVEAWHAKQREFNQRLGFLPYSINTGHITFYYREPISQILIKLRGGRYLAGDSGITLDLSRRFKSGLQMGVFASKTDISKEEFGEGSFDKGFYFFLPIELFFNNGYQKPVTGVGLRPITRDGAAYLIHGLTLWTVTDQAKYEHILRDWDDIYD